MDVTAEMITELRRRIAERDPDTSDFTDDDLSELIESVDGDLNHAAHEAWMLKAGWALEGKAIVLEAKTGTESLKLLGPMERYRHAIEMARFWQARLEDDVGVLAEQEADPEVPARRVTRNEDISRLLGIDLQ